MIKKINGLILDTLFPIRCIGCGREGFWICDNCFRQMRIPTQQVCGVCEKMITPDGRTCLACKRKSPLDGLVVAGSYLQPSVSKAVHLFKYRFIDDMHVPLGDLMAKVLRKTDFPLPDVIIPIPLHSRRLRWRGFNQSALLANHIASSLLVGSNLTVDENLLIRNRYTTPQMGIKDYGSRQQNITGAFSISNIENARGKTFLLVDDIATTGSTILECAQVLKAAGAQEVWAVVVARQETSK